MEERTTDPTAPSDPTAEELWAAVEQLREKLARQFAQGTLTDGEKREGLRVLYEAGKLAGLLESMTRAPEADHAG